MNGLIGEPERNEELQRTGRRLSINGGKHDGVPRLEEQLPSRRLEGEVWQSVLLHGR